MQDGWVKISSADLTAEIDPHGAQLSRLSDRQYGDLMWNGDPAVWAGRAPLLFPIVGVVAGGKYRLGSRTYALSRHGFARNKDFAVAGVSADTATFTLTADAATLEVYPFAFELSARFHVSGASLAVTTTIRNLGDVSMPASFGYHPAFRWPLPAAGERAAHRLEFEVDEPEPVRRLDAAGLLTAEKLPTPIEKRRLTLRDELFQNDALILQGIRSRSITYRGEHGPRLTVAFDDVPYLGLWSKPGAQFVCIEPWHGVSDSVGYTGDFKDKPGVFVLAPGQSRDASFSVTLERG